MGEIAIIGFLSVTGLLSLARPWIGVVISYLIVILAPQDVWWWQFLDMRPALIILIPTLLGFLFALFRQQYSFGTLGNKRVVFFLVLWLGYTISYLAGPYVGIDNDLRVTEPSWAMSTLNKMFFLFFLACICINDEKKLKPLIYVSVIGGIYLTYWVNHRYLTGQAWGRVAGPTNMDGVGIYADENNFAMLFVVALPILWYVGFSITSRWLRWALWLVMPFGWHAVFLTGSRGGLVGIAATLAIIVWRSSNRKFAFLLLPAFIIAYIWQAGDVMRERAATISEYETESSAAGRLQAWGAASGMIIDHPVTGVGLSSFVPAFPDYSIHHPREAHNTFLQIAAESGVVSGIMYVMIIVTSWLGLWRNGDKLKASAQNQELTFLYWANEGALVGLTGLIVCSVFLSLQMFEIFFYLGVVVNALLYISRTEVSKVTTAVARKSADVQ